MVRDEPSMRSTNEFRDGDQPSIAQSGVRDQSRSRTSAPVAPLPTAIVVWAGSGLSATRGAVLSRVTAGLRFLALRRTQGRAHGLAC